MQAAVPDGGGGALIGTAHAVDLDMQQTVGIVLRGGQVAFEIGIRRGVTVGVIGKRLPRLSAIRAAGLVDGADAVQAIHLGKAHRGAMPQRIQHGRGAVAVVGELGGQDTGTWRAHETGGRRQTAGVVPRVCVTHAVFVNDAGQRIRQVGATGERGLVVDVGTCAAVRIFHRVQMAGSGVVGVGQRAGIGQRDLMDVAAAVVGEAELAVVRIGHGHQLTGGRVVGQGGGLPGFIGDRQHMTADAIGLGVSRRAQEHCIARRHTLRIVGLGEGVHIGQRGGPHTIGFGERFLRAVRAEHHDFRGGTAKYFNGAIEAMTPLRPHRGGRDGGGAVVEATECQRRVIEVIVFLQIFVAGRGVDRVTDIGVAVARGAFASVIEAAFTGVFGGVVGIGSAHDGPGPSAGTSTHRYQRNYRWR